MAQRTSTAPARAGGTRTGTARRLGLPLAFLLSVLLLALTGTRIPTAAPHQHEAQAPVFRAADGLLQQPATAERGVEVCSAPTIGGTRDRHQAALAVLWATERAVRTAGARALRTHRRAPPALAVVTLLFPFHVFW